MAAGDGGAMCGVRMVGGGGGGGVVVRVGGGVGGIQGSPSPGL